MSEIEEDDYQCTQQLIQILDNIFQPQTALIPEINEFEVLEPTKFFNVNIFLMQTRVTQHYFVLEKLMNTNDCQLFVAGCMKITSPHGKIGLWPSYHEIVNCKKGVLGLNNPDMFNQKYAKVMELCKYGHAQFQFDEQGCSCCYCGDSIKERIIL